MHRRASLLASVLLTVASVNVSGARAQNVNVQVAAPTVTTTGSATIYVVPDEADLRFSISTFDRELPAAKQTNDVTAKELLTYFELIGIAANDIQTTDVGAEAVYGEQRVEGATVTRGPLTGYTVRRTYGVKLRDLTKLGAVYDKLLPDTRVMLHGHSLGTSHSREHRDQARRDAAVAAREKADLLATALGARLGGVRTISESSAQPYYPQNLYSNAMRAEQDAGGSDAATPLGQIEVRAEVTATFDLIQP